MIYNFTCLSFKPKINQIDNLWTYLSAVLTCYQPSNQYEIKNSIGQEVYRVKEESDCFARSVLAPFNNFKMRVENSTGQEVIRMEKPMQCILQEVTLTFKTNVASK